MPIYISEPINSPRREGVQVYVSESPFDFNLTNLCYRDVLRVGTLQRYTIMQWTFGII